MKDNFSTHAAAYAQFRPYYPDSLIQYLISLCKEKTSAWDCGTGNGQVAVALADHFKEVQATDISASQMKSAAAKNNIFYKVEAAEKTDFSNKQFDLITVAQAVHWFNFEEFYKEVKRTLKDEGIIAIIGYPLLIVNADVDAVIQKLYTSILGEYWDKERKLVDENYKTIPFPFQEIITPGFEIEYDWNFDQLTGYLGTWSSVQHFIKKNHLHPVQSMMYELKSAWGTEEKRRIKFPVLLRVGTK